MRTQDTTAREDGPQAEASVSQSVESSGQVETTEVRGLRGLSWVFGDSMRGQRRSCPLRGKAGAWHSEAAAGSPHRRMSLPQPLRHATHSRDLDKMVSTSCL